jgi:hypothetical protein
LLKGKLAADMYTHEASSDGKGKEPRPGAAFATAACPDDIVHILAV